MTAAADARPVRIALLAGELSGDQLGADLMRGLRRRLPQVQFEGVGGPAMEAEGLSSVYPLETFSVMGLVEVLRHLPGLLRIRRSLARRFIADPPDIFIGIDAPDFNLGLERRLRRHGIRTAHYVSPSVWAWRQGRIKGIRQSVDVMLTLFPFEANFYRDHDVPVVFVGHPAADRLPAATTSESWRRELELDPEKPVLALLPGSRRSEVQRLGPVYAAAAAKLLCDQPGLQVVAAMATAGVRSLFEEQLRALGLEGRVRLLDRQAEQAMGAADVVLAASGTATLEAMLLGRPMVMAYRLAPTTYSILKWLSLVKIQRYSLPNLLAGEAVVPEYVQDAATPDALAHELRRLLCDPGAREAQRARLLAMREQLQCSAGDRAAEAVIECLNAARN